MALEIELNWQGPYGLATQELRGSFCAPHESGLYLWAVGRPGKHQVSYVGQAENLSDRMYKHATSILGGAYCLYGPEHLLDGNKPEPRYEPGFPLFLANFLKDFDRLSRLAFEDLTSYTFFWAVLREEPQIRQAVESALIDAARKAGAPIQNYRVSLTPPRAKRIRITCRFQERLQVRGIPEAWEYGERD